MTQVIFQFQLYQMAEFEKSKRVSLYLHMKEEVQTTDIVEHLLASNKEYFIPYYKGKDSFLNFVGVP